MLSHYLSNRSERSKERGNVRFLATKISFTLEKFAMMLASDHADIEDSLQSQGAIGRLHSRVRDFPQLPESPYYELFDNELLNKILDFPDRVILANDAISHEADLTAHPEDLAGVTSEKCKLLATDALKLAERVREVYGLPSRELVYGNYDVRRWLKMHY